MEKVMPATIVVAGFMPEWLAPSANPVLFVFLLSAIASCVAAAIVCRRVSGEGARWVWIPFALLIIPFTYDTYPPARHFGNLWDQVFSPHCGASECLGQLFLGTPFLGAVMYAVTSLVVRLNTSKAADLNGS